MQFSHGGVLYASYFDPDTKSLGFEVDNKKKQGTPRYLYKYYPMNRYSVDAVLRNYLFASHPMLLNDKYDCSSELVDYSGFDKRFHPFYWKSDISSRFVHYHPAGYSNASDCRSQGRL